MVEPLTSFADNVLNLGTQPDPPIGMEDDESDGQLFSVRRNGIMMFSISDEYESSRGDIPEIRLRKAILEVAIRDLGVSCSGRGVRRVQRRSTKTCNYSHALRADAVRFFLEENGEFVGICKDLDLEPDVVRSRLMKMGLL